MMASQRRDLLVLLALSLAVRLVIAAALTRPGYMDAAYYAAGAVNLSRGGGLNEPFIWNYLGDPAGLPHPGFLYWMPLPSLLAAPLAVLFPGSFFALQLPFVLLSALLPPLVYGLAWQFSGRRRSAWLAGLLTLFSGFFFPYWTLPETFAPFGLAGALALWLAGGRGRGPESGRAGWLGGLLAGGLVGLAHLTRADGVLLLPAVAVGRVAYSVLRSPTHTSRNTHHALRTEPRVLQAALSGLALVTAGYLLVMLPWLLRNLAVAGTVLPSAGARTLWLTNYDDLFCYDCDLSAGTYLAWGWGNILASKLDALWVNLQRFWAEDTLIFLLPFVAVGFYRLRRQRPFVLSLLYLSLAYLAHSLAFTFPGPRGGFFHAAAAALPFVLAAGAEGLEASVGRLGRLRRWNLPQAQTVFAAATVLGALALSLYAGRGQWGAWRDADRVYEQVGAWLDARSEPDSMVVMVGNPPAFWYHTHRSAVAVPNGGPETLRAAADRYAATYLVLDANHPGGLAALYRSAGQGAAGLELLTTFDRGQVQLYRFYDSRDP